MKKLLAIILLLIAANTVRAEEGKFTARQDSIFKAWNERDSTLRIEMKSMRDYIATLTGNKKQAAQRSYQLVWKGYVAEMKHYILAFDSAAVYEFKRPSDTTLVIR
jgi:hypothetical protein